MNPKLAEALQRMDALKKAGKVDSKEMQEVLQEAILHSPPELIEKLSQLAGNLGLMPEVRYTENGEAVYSAADLAEHFGMSEDEVNESISELEARGQKVLHIAPDKVHRKN